MSKKQEIALEKLIVQLRKKYKISSSNVIGHNKVPFDLNPQKKQQTLCPGKKFKVSKMKKLSTLFPKSEFIGPVPD